MNKKKSNIIREISIPKTLDDLIQAPKKDIRVNYPKGLWSDWVCQLLEANMKDYYDLCYGIEHGHNALRYQLREGNNEDSMEDKQLKFDI